MTHTGVAFSGGGIRSAAFCSGVLRRLLERGVGVDYLSCVSGGGYTGTAYLDWKCQEERRARTEEARQWHEEFFENMTKKSGYICDWQKPLKGILDTIILSFLVLLSTVIIPLIKWGSYACPLAILIDLFFGRLLRKTADCDVLARSKFEVEGYESTKGNTDARNYTNETMKSCIEIQGPKQTEVFALFAVLFVLFLLCYLLKLLLLELKRLSRYSRVVLRLGQFIFGSCFIFTFIPFAIFDFVVNIPLWAQLLLLPIFIVVWAVVPLLRKRTSHVLIVFSYCNVIYWRVYRGEFLGAFAYDDHLFYWMLLFSGFGLWIVPIATSWKDRVVHVYNRWRLQKAFYHKDSIGLIGCSGIRVWDCCPQSCFSRNRPEFRPVSGPLTLADLEGMKPEYLSNVVVNRWKLSRECEKKYELLIMSPNGIERLDAEPSTMQFEGKLEPRDVMLSDAMATSAAALSSHMGKYSFDSLTRLHSILGLEMGATMIFDAKSTRNKIILTKSATWLIDFFRGLPLILVQVLYYFNDLSGITDVDTAVKVALVCFFVIHLVLTLIALIDTGRETPSWWEKLARWFIVHSSYVYNMRELLAADNTGPVPPPVLLLSDGGHIENLGILPLLKRRLPKIVVVDGGHKDEQKNYGDSLLDALMLARTKLRCSFLSEDGKDVTADLLEKFVEPTAKGLPRYYKFEVRYPRNEFGEESDGEILLLAPRDPKQSVDFETEGTVAVDLYPFDETYGLQNGMVLEEDDVRKLTLCCCECCHREACQGFSKMFCNIFPQHFTGNQFFTPRMFSAYHREGYRACVEADAAEFLMNTRAEMEATDIGING